MISNMSNEKFEKMELLVAATDGKIFHGKAIPFNLFGKDNKSISFWSGNAFTIIPMENVLYITFYKQEENSD